MYGLNSEAWLAARRCGQHGDGDGDGVGHHDDNGGLLVSSIYYSSGMMGIRNYNSFSKCGVGCAKGFG